MSFLLERSTMVFRQRIEVRSCSGTALGQITEFVNMDTVLTVWVKALD
jgi:hypothetical protein